jgi:hypothetical protein
MSEALAEQLAAALSALQELNLKVLSLEARLSEQEEKQRATKPQSSSGMDFLQQHQRLALRQPSPNQLVPNGHLTAADRLNGTQPAGSRGGGGGSGSAALPPVPPGFVANPDVQEASMAQTRVVMAEIVSPADSNGLDICNVSQSERSCACLYVEAAARCRRRRQNSAGLPTLLLAPFPFRCREAPC